MTKKTGPESPLRLEFGYDERSRRITKRVLTGSNYQTLVETRRFIWDGWLMAGEVIEKGSSTETKTYLWGWDVSGSEEGAGGVGGLIAVQNTSGVHFPIYDGNGNTRHLWGATEGTVVDSADYGPFGELTQSPATEHSPFWFSSKYWDQESGFLYYGYRFYNPATGRWINRDPIEERGGVNLYGFVENGIINVVDSWGKSPHEPKRSRHRGPRWYDHLAPDLGGIGDFEVDNTEWFSSHYNGWITYAKAEYTRRINIAVRQYGAQTGFYFVTMKDRMPDFPAYRPNGFTRSKVDSGVLDERRFGDEPQSIFSADKVLGTFVIKILKDEVSVLGAEGIMCCENNKRENLYSWSATLIVYDVLGLHAGVDHEPDPAYNSITGRIFPERGVIRAKWRLSGDGVLCPK